MINFSTPTCYLCARNQLSDRDDEYFIGQQQVLAIATGTVDAFRQSGGDRGGHCWLLFLQTFDKAVER